MNRLTTKNGGCANIGKATCSTECWSCWYKKEMLRRLAAYEDTGLGPVEVEKAVRKASEDGG